MQQATIGLSVQGGEQTISFMDRMRRAADEYQSKAIRQAREYGASVHEGLADLERQVRTLERRRDLETSQRQAQNIPGGQGATTAIGSGETQTTKSVPSLLLELNQTVRAIFGHLTKGGGGDGGDGTGGGGGDGAGQGRSDGGRGRMGQAANMGMGLATSRNEYTMLAAAAGGLIPVIGQAVGQGMSRVFTAAENYQTAYTGTYAQTGRMRKEFGKGLEGYGIDMPMAYNEMRSLAGARGGAYGERNAIQSAMYQRALGLQSGDIAGLERTLRGTSQTGTGVIQSLGGGMIAAGGMQRGDMSLLPEYMRVLVSLNQDQLNTLGEVDTGINEKMMMGITGLDESFKNPEVLQNVLGQINQGLKQAATPQAEALQYSVLSGMNTEASFFDIQKMREAPDIKYFEGVMNELQNISGGGKGNKMFYQNIMEMFGTSATTAENIGKGFEDEKLQESFEQFNRKGGLGVDIKGRAENATGALLEGSIKFQNTFATVGDKLTTYIDKLIDKIQDFIDSDDKETKTNTILNSIDGSIKKLVGKTGQSNMDLPFMY